EPQLGARHWIVGYAHAEGFVPSQVPPQEEPSVAHAFRPPCGAPATAVHVPAVPARSHAWHWPSQAVSQHTPSTQWPLPHWSAAPHVPPGGSLGTHRPAEQ